MFEVRKLSGKKTSMNIVLEKSTDKIFNCNNNNVSKVT